MQPSAPFYELAGQIAIDLPGARAIFTTRAWGDVRETIGGIGARLGVAPVRARQVHGSTVVATGDVQPDTEADALFTTTSGVAPCVLAADCVPIVVAGPGVVAAVHAGWRGLAGGVIGQTLMQLRAHLGGTGALALSGAIGPAAGACCYEVGPELHARFPGFSQRKNLDLKAIARTQLEQAGVTDVHDAGICTICSSDPECFSYRREGAAAGRQGALVWLS